MAAGGGSSGALRAALDAGMSFEAAAESGAAGPRMASVAAFVAASVEHTAASHGAHTFEASSARHHLSRDDFALQVVDHCTKHLLVYPYTLLPVLVAGSIPPAKCVTPYRYYYKMIWDAMTSGRSFDTIPNFTASDVKRLLGVARNEYIHTLNEVRTGGGKWKVSTAALKEKLASHPPDRIDCEPWWVVLVNRLLPEQMGSISSEDYPTVMWLKQQQARGAVVTAAGLGKDTVQRLYAASIVSFVVPTAAEDRVYVPTLSTSFVMNRNPSSDSAERVLYDVFVLVDKDRPLSQVAEMLGVKVDVVLAVVSMYLRLGFMRKVGAPEDWVAARSAARRPSMDVPTSDAATAAVAGRDGRAGGSGSSGGSGAGAGAGAGTASFGVSAADIGSGGSSSSGAMVSAADAMAAAVAAATADTRRAKAALLFDSSIVSVLMMGNLSYDLKQHAVTLFEAGSLSGDALHAFVTELGSVREISSSEGGDAASYSVRALALRHTLRTLTGVDDSAGATARSDDTAAATAGAGDAIAGAGAAAAGEPSAATASKASTSAGGRGRPHWLELQMLRSGSLINLAPASRTRLLQATYGAIVPLTDLTVASLRSVDCLGRMPFEVRPTFVGATPTMRSPWFRLWLSSHARHSSPTTWLIPAGTRLRKLPTAIQAGDTWLVSEFDGGDEDEVAREQLLHALNTRLPECPLLVRSTPSAGATQMEVDLTSTDELPGGGAAVVSAVRNALRLPVPLGFATFSVSRRAGAGARDAELDADAGSVAGDGDGVGGVGVGGGERDTCQLDAVSFGVPLHSLELNRLVCAAARDGDLLSPRVLKRQAQALRKLHRRVWRFALRTAAGAAVAPASADADTSPATPVAEAGDQAADSIAAAMAHAFRVGRVPWPPREVLLVDGVIRDVA